MLARSRIALSLSPADALLFRDSRPFDMGGEARSIYPNPQTIAGALRKWLLAAYEISLSDLWKKIGYKADQTARDRLRDALPPEAKWVVDIFVDGPLLEKNGSVYVPIPRHMMCGDDNILVPAQPLSEDVHIPTVSCGDMLPKSVRPLWLDARNEYVFKPGWIHTDTLRHILSHSATPLSQDVLHDEGEFFLPEPHVRIALDPNTGQAADGMLFMTSFLRMKTDVSLRVEISSEDVNLKSNLEMILKSNPWLVLGGEQRIAQVEILEEPLLLDIADEVDSENRISYMLTPGFFYGAYPKKVVERDWWLCGAATGDPLPVSGWDGIQGGGPKPKKTRYAVRAGSVFFWRKLKPDAVMPTHVCSDPKDNRLGWGRMIAGGGWEYVD